MQPAFLKNRETFTQIFTEVGEILNSAHILMQMCGCCFFFRPILLSIL